MPKGVAIDEYGNRYVSSYGPESGNEGRIDIFDSTGNFITEIDDPNGPKAVAVDSEGNLYVSEAVPGQGSGTLSRYEPTVPYEPQAGTIAYEEPPILITNESTFNGRLAVNRTNDHLFVNMGGEVWEYAAAAEENELLDTTIGKGQFDNFPRYGVSGALAIDAAQRRIYAEDHDPSNGNVVLVFDLSPPHTLVGTIDGTSTPTGKFTAETTAGMALAVEESTGHLFVGDMLPAKKVYELEINGGSELTESYVSTITHGFQPLGWPQIAIDNSPKSPNLGYLFVPSSESAPGRSLAFKPKEAELPPVVESTSFAGVTEDEAILGAKINPKGKEASYRFEYTTQQSFDSEAFAGAILAGEGTLAAGVEGVSVSAPVAGLQPGTPYRFRVLAESDAGSDEEQRGFTTYRAPDASEDCPNDALRTGASTGLPDCRAYELVTPPDTNGHSPSGGTEPNLNPFGSFIASPTGDNLSYTIEGGPLSGFEGAGYVAGDPYLATRTGAGWVTSAAGPGGTESEAPIFGGISPDQGYSFWTAQGSGSALLEGQTTSLLRYPDGHSEPIGRGSLGVEAQATGRLITDGGTHTIFSSGDASLQLEPNAPPAGTPAIYDRSADEVTHVVSLLPGGATPVENEDAFWAGASADGSAVAFKLADPASGGVNQSTAKSPLYLRLDNAETLIAAPAGATFAGLSADGRHLFYLLEEDLYRFDVQGEATSAITEGGGATVVNISADGSAVYFVSSSSVAFAEEENPLGEVPQPGEANLYLSREGSVVFIATLTPADVAAPGLLGSWIDGVARGELSQDPSRSTPDGGVLLFESRADLTKAASGGHVEVYRYDAQAPSLSCLSCNPTLAAASGDARLAPVRTLQSGVEPLAGLVLLRNLRDDGARAFFQTTEPLLLADSDETLDVYEWEQEGVGSCLAQGGCVYLISSGRSAEPSYLFAVSQSGDDVFISTTDLLSEDDPDQTRSIYDVRVNGGFAPKAGSAAECLGEACQPTVVAPNYRTPASSSSIGAGNLDESNSSRCPKGKRARRGGGQTRCVVKHPKKKHPKAKKRASGTGRAGR